MAFIEPMHRNKPNFTYLLLHIELWLFYIIDSHIYVYLLSYCGNEQYLPR